MDLCSKRSADKAGPADRFHHLLWLGQRGLSQAPCHGRGIRAIEEQKGLADRLTRQALLSFKTSPAKETPTIEQSGSKGRSNARPRDAFNFMANLSHSNLSNSRLLHRQVGYAHARM